MVYETALSKKGLSNSLKRLTTLGLVRVWKVRPGDQLPSGMIAARVRSIYQLTEKVTGVKSTREQNTREQATPVEIASSPVSSSPTSGVIDTTSLHDRNIEKTNRKDDGRSTKEWASLGLRFTSMISSIQENQPLDPNELWQLVRRFKSSATILRCGGALSGSTIRKINAMNSYAT